MFDLALPSDQAELLNFQISPLSISVGFLFNFDPACFLTKYYVPLLMCYFYELFEMIWEISIWYFEKIIPSMSLFISWT